MLKIGVVPYINALPLYKYLPYPVSYGTPVELEARMACGDLDIALLPTFSFFQNPNYLPLFEGGGIQSTGPVESVVLHFREAINNPKEISSVKFSEDSITSVALFKVIYHIFWKNDLTQLKLDSTNPDAFLHIGDKALTLEEEGMKSIDLGQVWHDFVGLPFVYAFWVSRQDIPDEVVAKFKMAKREGLAKRNEMIEGNHDFPTELIRDYLTKKIRYEITLRSLEGLKRFQDYCFDAGLIKEKRKLLGSS